jgi:hypothetical protein
MKTAAGSKPSRITLSGELKLRRDPAGNVLADAAVEERRAKPRLNKPFPTKAWGTDAEGQLFEIDGSLGNISSTGLYLRLPRRLNSGAELSVVIQFVNGQSGPTALLCTQVLRAEPQPEGDHGFALAIKEHHFV